MITALRIQSRRWFWQPIATAPQSGSPLLLWDPYYLMCIGRYEPRVVAEIWGRSLPLGVEGQWLQDLPYAFERGQKELKLEPTHWRYLPKAPKSIG